MTIASSFASTSIGRAAFERAVEEAERRGAALIVVPDTREEAGSDQEAIAWARGLARSKGVILDVRRVPGGRSATDELLDVSFMDEVDLLVLGVRRRSPIGKLFLGSMAQQLILEAGCDVLTIKPPVGSVE